MHSCGNPSTGNRNAGAFLPGLKPQPLNPTLSPPSKHVSHMGQVFCTCTKSSFLNLLICSILSNYSLIIRTCARVTKDRCFRLNWNIQAANPDVLSDKCHYFISCPSETRKEGRWLKEVLNASLPPFSAQMRYPIAA